MYSAELDCMTQTQLCSILTFQELYTLHLASCHVALGSFTASMSDREQLPYLVQIQVGEASYSIPGQVHSIQLHMRQVVQPASQDHCT